MYLIPEPRDLQLRTGSFDPVDVEYFHLAADAAPGLLEAVVTLAGEWEARYFRRPRFRRDPAKRAREVSFVRRAVRSECGPEGYELTITPNCNEAAADSEAGLFYAVQTLRQLVRSCGNPLPCLEIADAPELSRRGFYHDVTRGRVPTLATLKFLADKLAYYKLNELQLYVEHTFAFAGESDMWAGADPLTAEEILELDAYCRSRHIDLVPSLSTFGHFYMGLRSSRKEHLNELDMKASELPYSFMARMAHYTLNPGDPDSFALVKRMLGEFIPLFSSKFFNICCDETFDLGKGKSRAEAEKAGVTRIYCDFLKKIIAEVNTYGKRAMFWGDIILEHPELVRELPEGTIVFDWNYSPEFDGSSTAKFAANGAQFYVCPGTGVWNNLAPDIAAASENIRRAANYAVRYGAIGLLNTNWGDFGNVNMIGQALHGLAFGGNVSWNSKASDQARFDRAYSSLELGCPDTAFVDAWREAAPQGCTNWGCIQLMIDPGVEKSDEERRELWLDRTADQYLAGAEVFAEARRVMTRAAGAARPLAACAIADVILGMRGQELLHRAAAVLAGRADGAWLVADAWRSFESDFTRNWHADSKPSEYFRLRMQFLKLGETLDALGAEK